MLNVATQPNRVRTLTLAGPLHSGKTALVDMLWQETHHVDVPLNKEIRYTDTRLDEQARKISLKSTPFTMLLPDMKDVQLAGVIITLLSLSSSLSPSFCLNCIESS